MQKLTSIPTSLADGQVLYLATPEENVIVTNNGEWMPTTKHTAELTAKTAEIETLKTQIDNTSKELTSLKKEFKEVDGFKEKIEKLEADKKEMESKIELVKKTSTTLEAVKDYYSQTVGVNAKYLKSFINEQHPDLSTVVLDANGKFALPEDKVKEIRTNYPEIIGEIKTKGWTPENPDPSSTNDEPKSFAEEFKDKFH